MSQQGARLEPKVSSPRENFPEPLRDIFYRAQCSLPSQERSTLADSLFSFALSSSNKSSPKLLVAFPSILPFQASFTKVINSLIGSLGC